MHESFFYIGNPLLSRICLIARGFSYLEDLTGVSIGGQIIWPCDFLGQSLSSRSLSLSLWLSISPRVPSPWPHFCISRCIAKLLVFGCNILCRINISFLFVLFSAVSDSNFNVNINFLRALAIMPLIPLICMGKPLSDQYWYVNDSLWCGIMPFFSPHRRLIIFSPFFSFNCSEISKFYQILTNKRLHCWWDYLDNGFGYSLIDNRGNEETFWHELDSLSRGVTWNVYTHSLIWSHAYFGLDPYLEELSTSCKVNLLQSPVFTGQGLTLKGQKTTDHKFDLL